jgi:hypothetical protein
MLAGPNQPPDFRSFVDLLAELESREPHYLTIVGDAQTSVRQAVCQNLGERSRLCFTRVNLSSGACIIILSSSERQQLGTQRIPATSMLSKLEISERYIAKMKVVKDGED